MVCGRPAVSRDRCDTCYRFRRRTGRDRDPGRNVEANRRRLERDQEEAWIRSIYVDAQRRLDDAEHRAAGSAPTSPADVRA
jgi:hypothetical protein